MPARAEKRLRDVIATYSSLLKNSYAPACETESLVHPSPFALIVGHCHRLARFVQVHNVLVSLWCTTAEIWAHYEIQSRPVKLET